jgi:hypothetical protein
VGAEFSVWVMRRRWSLEVVAGGEGGCVMGGRVTRGGWEVEEDQLTVGSQMYGEKTDFQVCRLPIILGETLPMHRH